MNRFERFIEMRLERDGKRFERLAGVALGVLGGAAILLGGIGENDAFFGLMLAAVICGGLMNLCEKLAGARLKTLSRATVATLAVSGAIVLALKWV